MLHIAFVTHTPETCPAALPDVTAKAHRAFVELEGACKRRGMTVVGGWVNRPAHAIYLVLDAPNAHAVSELAIDLNLPEWSTVSVEPVIELSELREALGRLMAADP